MKKIIKTISKAILIGTAVEIGSASLLFEEVFTRRNPTKRQFLNKLLGSQDGKDLYAKYEPLRRKGNQWLKDMEPTSQYWTVQSKDGLKLSARFIPAKTETTKTILCVHGYHSTGEEEYVLIGNMFHDAGYNVLLIDQRAHGKSEGKYIGFGCLEKEDIILWIQGIEEYFNHQCEIFLHGVSMGAATVLMTSGIDLPETVKGIVADCGYTSPNAILHSVVESGFVKIPGANTLIKNINSICKIKAHYSLDACSSLDAVSKSKCPIFIIHGDQDILVPVHMAHEIYEHCTNKKEIWIAQGANHAESSCMYPKEYKERVIQFFEEC